MFSRVLVAHITKEHCTNNPWRVKEHVIVQQSVNVRKSMIGLYASYHVQLWWNTTTQTIVIALSEYVCTIMIGTRVYLPLDCTKTILRDHMVIQYLWSSINSLSTMIHHNYATWEYKACLETICSSNTRETRQKVGQ